MTAPADRIIGLETVRLGDLSRIHDNPKQHTHEDSAGLRASLKKHGYVLPILARPLGRSDERGKYQIVDGWDRHDQLVQQLGENAKVKVLLVDVKDEREAGELILVLQRHTEFSPSMLTPFVERLIEQGSTVDDIVSMTNVTAEQVDALAQVGVDFLSDIPMPKAKTKSERQEPDWVPLVVSMTAEQREWCMKELRQARKDRSVDDAGQVLVTIIKEWKETK